MIPKSVRLDTVDISAKGLVGLALAGMFVIGAYSIAKWGVAKISGLTTSAGASEDW
jgi:hypothetical protein